ncbi:glycosyltransferase family 4 protein [Microbulbifer sp. TYP-18]|uniref:glycosyltransferase family 4 protein n=1 Tax=Microbulbifer sp. TYP-18 TaxID=3230024 RepID=UPI0034C5FACC
MVYIVNVDWYFLLHWQDRAEAAQQCGYSVHILTASTDPVLAVRIADLGFKLHEIPLSRRSLNPVREISCVMQLYSLLKDLQPDIVHCVTLKPVVYGGFIARWRNIPCLSSVVGLGYAYSKDTVFYRSLWAGLEKLMGFAFAARKTMVSFENRHDMELLRSRQVLSGSQAVILPGAGVDLDRFSWSEEVDDGRTTLKILFAGRLLKSKGLDQLVAAVESLRRQGKTLELHVAGIVDSDSRDAIPGDELTQWISGGIIDWHGQVRDIERLIADVNLVCLPTRYGEGLPRILVEAGAVGRAVVATDMPGCSEFIHSNRDGLLVPAGDLEALESAIGALVDDPDRRRQLATNARKKVEQTYSNEHVIAQTLGLYEDLLRNIVP